MKMAAIKQEKPGQNTLFITEDFEKYSLDELTEQENIPNSNIQVITSKTGKKYLRSKPNSNASDNLDEVAITCNTRDYLLFDREYLYLKAINGRTKQKWPAFSGKPDSSIDDQNQKNYGPLPEGEYAVSFENTISYENNEGLWDAIKWKIKSKNWGYIATPLEQVKGESYDRGNFYIHSGREIGTAGCIELVEDLNKNFHSFMSLYNRSFRLVVKY